MFLAMTHKGLHPWRLERQPASVHNLHPRNSNVGSHQTEAAIS
jgi:hypothetical protein